MKIWHCVRLSGLTFLSGMAVVALAAIGLASCGRGAGDVWTDESGLLRYVPADTPYLLASGEPTPEDLMEKIEPWAQSIVEGYVSFMRTMIDNAINNPAFAMNNPALGDPAQRERIDAIMDLAAELMTVEGRESAGFTRDSKMVVYGNGLLPVMRMTLDDGAKLEATVARIEQTADARATVATSGEHSYRYWGNEDGQIILAIIDDEAVLTGGPTSVLDEHLGALLDGQVSGENIAASGKLGEIAEKYSFDNHLVGFIDVQEIAATFLDEPTGINADLLALAEYDNSEFSNACKTEIRGMAGVAPRLVLGSTAMNAEEIGVNMVMELREDIAAGLSMITAPVPGLGTLRAGVISVGLGLDVAAARDFALARINALAADPYECEMLADISTAVPEMRAMLNQPLPPEVFDFKGAVVALDEVGDFDLASGQMPTELSARVLLAIDNAPSLAAMGAMFSPEIAALQPNGEPVRVNLPIPLPIPLEVWAALTDSAAAVAVGPGGDARVREILAAPVSEHRPFMSWETDYQAYYGLMAQAMEMAALADPTMGPQVIEPAQQLLGLLSGGPFEREYYDVRFTANGVEMPTLITLTD